MIMTDMTLISSLIQAPVWRLCKASMLSTARMLTASALQAHSRPKAVYVITCALMHITQTHAGAVFRGTFREAGVSEGVLELPSLAQVQGKWSEHGLTWARITHEAGVYEGDVHQGLPHGETVVTT